jgi:hypothetical protein
MNLSSPPVDRSPAHGLLVALAQQQKAAAMTGIRKKNQQNCRGKRQQIGNSAQLLAWQECESFRGTSALSAPMGQMRCERP